RVVIEWLAVDRNRLLERRHRAGAGLVASVEKNLLVRAPQQTCGFSLFRIVLGQAGGQWLQHVDRHRCHALLDEALRIQTSIARVVRKAPAERFGELHKKCILALVAQFLDEGARLSDLVFRAASAYT